VHGAGGRAHRRRESFGLFAALGADRHAANHKETAQVLNQSEAGLRAVIDTIPTHVWTCLADGSDAYFNRGRLDYTGPDVDWYASLHPDDQALHDVAWAEAVGTGASFECEQRMVAADGSYRWFLIRAAPLRDDLGKIVRWIGVNIDIDDLKTAQAGLQRVERELRAAFDTIPVLAWRARTDGSTDYLNRRFLDYTGLGPEDAMESGWAEVVHPDDVPSLHALWQSLLGDPRPGETEARLRRFDGVYRWFLFRVEPLFDGTGNVECWYGTNTDIEGRKQAEQVRADTESELRAVIDTIPAQIWRTGPDGETDFINRTRAEFDGGTLSWRDKVHPDDVLKYHACWDGAYRAGEPFEQEVRLRRTDGTYRWFLVRAAPRRDESGHVIQWFGTNTDIDGLKHAQERIHRSEQDLRDAIDTIPTHVWSTLPDGSDVYLNRRRLEYAGQGVGFEAIVHPEDVAEHNETWAASVRTGKPWEVECRLHRVDGTYRWFLIRAEPLCDSQGRIVRWFGTNTDIDDLRVAQQGVSRAERELRATIDTIPAHIWSCLPDGTADYVNRRRVEYTGPDVSFYGIVHPDDRPEHDAKWAMSVRTGQPFEVENRLRRADGAYHWFLGRAEPLRDDDGRIVKWFGTNTDIDNLRRAEEALQRAQAELAHVTRVATLGELTASIAHEVNQPLAGIVTNGEACLRWLRREQPNLDEALGAVERIIGDGIRAGQVVHRLQALSRKDEPAWHQLNLNELVEESLPLVAQEMTRRMVTLKLSLSSDLPAVLGDRVQLQQVLINLIINGIQAMAEVTGRRRVVTVSSWLEDAVMVALAVRDSGPGLDPDTSGRLFDAFFTTKPNGMGMGLSICRSIVEAHGGRIWADGAGASGRTSGAVFQLTLPAHRDT
jgi:PAS domain S-box-containing protein